MLLIPSAIPRWLAGKASVRIAAELASRKAAPTPCTMRKTIRYSAPVAPGHPVDRQEQRGDRVDDEAEVVHLHPPVHVPEPPEADDQHARHDQEAEDHPQQVEAVRRHQRVEVDAPEDARHRDQHDRPVERRQQHPQRHVRQRDPLVAIRGGRARNLFRDRRCGRGVHGPSWIDRMPAHPAKRMLPIIRDRLACARAITWRRSKIPIFSIFDRSSAVDQDPTHPHPDVPIFLKQVLRPGAPIRGEVGRSRSEATAPEHIDRRLGAREGLGRLSGVNGVEQSQWPRRSAARGAVRTRAATRRRPRPRLHCCRRRASFAASR